MPTGEPKLKEKPKPIGMAAGMARTPAHDVIDIRDVLTGTLGKGYTSLSDDSVRANYARLAGLVGVPAAQKLMNRIFVFNQLDNVKGLPLDQKVMQFYDSSVDDASIEPFLKQSKSFGMGPIAGLRDSPDVMNMELSGRLKPSLASGLAFASPIR